MSPQLTPVTTAALDAVQRAYGLRFCPDARDYFAAHPAGLDLDWAAHPTFLSDKRAGRFGDRYDAVLEALGTEPYGETEHFPERLYAFAELRDELADLTREDGGAHARFLPLFYPVGVYPNGDELVQIAAGRRRGQLLMLDHEYYFGGLSLLLTAEGRAELGYGGTLEPADADAFVDFCLGPGYLVALEEPYDTLGGVLGGYRETLEAHLRVYRALDGRERQDRERPNDGRWER